MTRKEQLIEYARILKDTPYALRTYLKTYDNTQKKYVPLELFPDQVQLIKDYESYNDNITRKYRQAGVTTVTAAWISKLMQFAKKTEPHRILIIANKLDTSIEMANKIRAFLEQWPDWINVGFSPDKNSERRFKLNNGCEVKAVATSKDALRGFTPTILVFDEAAFIEAGEDFWAASMASLSCVHEDSYILTDGGLIQLKNIVTEKTKIGFTPYTGSLQVINKDLQITNIKSTFKSELADCYRIKTKSGFELIGSWKHPLLTEKNGSDEWVRMVNLKIGDKIKIQYNQNLFGKDPLIDFPSSHGNEIEKIKIPERLNQNLDLAYLMGLYVAEGSLSGNTIQIANGDEEIERFLINFGFVNNAVNKFYYCSSQLKRFMFDYVGMEHSIAKNKKIPQFILQSSRETIVEFLRGLFDGDGCATTEIVKYSSTSKELVHQLQILLSNFGIRTNIHYSEYKTSDSSIIKNKEHVAKMYDLIIRGEHRNRFMERIGFRLSRKMKFHSYYQNKINNKSFIPATKIELKKILEENGISRTQYEREYRFLDLLMRKNKDHITVHALNRLLTKNLKNKTTLQLWIDRYKETENFYYEEIVDIDTFQDLTYDLEIPNGSSFISNSIISHNTGGKVILVSCVVKGTFVFTENGIEEVGDFIDPQKPVGEGYFVEPYTVLGKDSSRTSDIMLNNGLQKTKIITSLHSQIEGTHTHKVWAYSTREEKYGWYRFDELSVGDYLNTGYNFNKWGDNDTINFNYVPTNKETNIFIPTELTDDIMYFMGLYLAEGSCYKKYNNNNLTGVSLTLTCGDDISGLLNRLNLKYHNGDGIHYTISSKSLGGFMEYMGFDLTKHAKEKEIPKRLLSLSKDKIRHLIRGIFDGDGFSDKTRARVGIGLSSAKLIKQIRIILMNFGILTDFNVVNSRPTKLVAVESLNYRITTSSKYSKIFYNEIGSGFERKQSKSSITENYVSDRKDSRDIIPNGSHYLSELIINNKIRRKNLSPEGIKVYDQLNKTKNLSRDSFTILYSEIKTITGIGDDFIEDKILIDNSKWDVIKTIEDSENETFDFSLYENKNDFWCHSIYYNGILGHQTPNGYDPIYYGVYDQAIKGLNNFHITDLRWFKDPRYNKDLRWIKCADVVHYMLNRDEYDDEEITLKDWKLENYNEYLEQGYKPISSWFEDMSKKFKFDKRQISQELECVDGNTKVTVKHKQTNEITELSVNKLKNLLEKYNKDNNIDSEFHIKEHIKLFTEKDELSEFIDHNKGRKQYRNTVYDILTPDGFQDFDGIERTKKKTIELLFDDTSILRGSPKHSVVNSDGEIITLESIRIGDTVKTINGSATVTDIVKHNHKTFVYDIINTGYDHLYYSNGIVSHNCDFLGSGDAVISTVIQQNIRENMVCEPKEKYHDSKLWQWKEPVEGHRYVMGIDPSRGDSEDFGAINIIDIDAMEQVVEFIDKLPPDDLAVLAYKWGILYDALIVVDITGGMGVATSRKLQELGYKNLYVEGQNSANIWEVKKTTVEKIPGLNFNNKRLQIIAAFEENLRKNFRVNSSRLSNEISTFVFVNGRPDHMKGMHDDSIMSIAMPMYVAEISFASLERNNNLNKAMINSWITSERSYELNPTHYSYGKDFDSIGAMSNGAGVVENHIKNQYTEYSWLFGGVAKRNT